MMRSAVISACGRFRYELTRQWDAHLPAAVYVMLNPSTADAEVDDQTIRKCIGFAERLGFGAFTVVNLFAFRATKPADLKRNHYPIGPDNDRAIMRAVAAADATVICAWGFNAKGLARPAEVLDLLRQAGKTPMALHVNASGEPAHPLMLAYTHGLRPLG